MKEITINKLFELYVDTLNQCGAFLLNQNDDEIALRIFEEFDIGTVSFLHEDALKQLLANNYINKAIFQKSLLLRGMVDQLRSEDKWQLHCVRQDPEWLKVMKLSDDILEAVHKYRAT